jgi:FMN phosphatase YigB (HAD superfamily)
VRSFDVITFDCYGTLIDWESSIAEALRKASLADGVSLDPATVLLTLFDTRPAAERPYQRYREILTAAAERVRSYKPAPGHFTGARQQIGTHRWLHAARSYFHDVIPAVTYGIPVAWINRAGDQPPARVRPNYEFRNLTELADSH